MTLTDNFRLNLFIISLEIPAEHLFLDQPTVFLEQIPNVVGPALPISTYPEKFSAHYINPVYEDTTYPSLCLYKLFCQPGDVSGADRDCNPKTAFSVLSSHCIVVGVDSKVDQDLYCQNLHVHLSRNHEGYQFDWRRSLLARPRRIGPGCLLADFV